MNCKNCGIEINDDSNPELCGDCFLGEKNE
jgi:NMD protein affecting ribosome stability and mRNA decay